MTKRLQELPLTQRLQKSISNCELTGAPKAQKRLVMDRG